MAKKKQSLPPGDYTGIRIKSVKIVKGKVQLELDFSAVSKVKKEDVIWTQGLHKFFIACGRLGIYTSIGADNRYHAANKATKLFGVWWSAVCTEYQIDLLHGLKAVPYMEFKEAIKTLQI